MTTSHLKHKKCYFPCILVPITNTSNQTNLLVFVTSGLGLFADNGPFRVTRIGEISVSKYRCLNLQTTRSNPVGQEWQ